MLAQQFGAMEQMLAQDLNSPAMAELEQTDKAEWLVAKQHIGERVQWLQNTRQQLAANYAQFVHNLKTQASAREEKLLMEAIPDFGETHRTTAWQTMESLGYGKQELANVFIFSITAAASSTLPDFAARLRTVSYTHLTLPTTPYV